MKERLLKRVRQWNNDNNNSLKQIEGQEFIESVRIDIENLLNTRRGTVLIDDAMGLPDATYIFNGFSMPDIDAFQKKIMRQIMNFEPRLSHLSLSFIGEQSQQIEIVYQLTAQLQYGTNTLSFTAKVMLNENGSVSISL